MSSTGAVLAILAAAVIVLTGLAALARAIWKAAQDVRDNRLATVRNTEALKALGDQLGLRMTAIEARLSHLEGGA
jgi:hypothetical protein